MLTAYILDDQLLNSKGLEMKCVFDHFMGIFGKDACSDDHRFSLKPPFSGDRNMTSLLNPITSWRWKWPVRR